MATSLMLLAFLGAGHSEKVGLYKQNVKNAVAWLIKHQAEDGSITDTTDANNPKVILPPQALATFALSESTGMCNGKIPETKTAAQKAIDFCAAQQEIVDGLRCGWGFGAKAPSDLRATIWYVMALKSAKVSGLKVEHSSFDGIGHFLDIVEHKNVAQTPSGPASVYWRTAKIEEPEQSHVLTAMGILARQFTGSKKEDLQASVEGFIAKGGNPDWKKPDFLYWYFGSLCVFQQGGYLWLNWSQAKCKALNENQIKEGDEAGNWKQSWGAMLGALCMNFYYRGYMPLQPK